MGDIPDQQQRATVNKTPPTALRAVIDRGIDHKRRSQSNAKPKKNRENFSKKLKKI